MTMDRWQAPISKFDPPMVPLVVDTEKASEFMPRRVRFTFHSVDMEASDRGTYRRTIILMSPKEARAFQTALEFAIQDAMDNKEDDD
jgi:hypothetical protein